MLIKLNKTLGCLVKVKGNQVKGLSGPATVTSYELYHNH